jgi:hypothetical protein
MTARIRIRDNANTLRTIDGTGTTRIRMRDAANTLRTITRVRMRGPDNVLRVVYDVSGASSFAATADYSIVYGSSTSSTVVTSTVTVTPTGGIGPYFHSWALVSNTNLTPPTVNSPAASATAFTQTNVDPDVDDQAVFRDTVTDSATPANSTTVDVTGVFLNRSHDLGGIRDLR